MENKNSDMKTRVEARVQAEKGKNNKKDQDTSNNVCISDSDIHGYINDNRKGDAILYNRLNRGKIIYVAEWQKFLFWNGHHWEEDYMDSHACIAIEKVCEIYDDFARRKQKEADEELDKIRKVSLQKLADKVQRRIDLLHDKNGQDNLLT